ncbi:MAG: protein-L-isoaspartate O-methyltransferase [Gammaproteobacteria bacterium]|jgi:protein-L-isoaspartate(D-aspartate) O-methyltransferase
MNFQRARFNMVEQQIRTWDVLDQRVLDIIRDTPREDYVPEAFRKLAYADTSIPLEEGEVMMPPRVEARLLQALQLKPDEHVLEIGTGSGYLTALLAQLAGRVVSVEISETLAARARAALEAHVVKNVVVEVGDAVRGWESAAPYDAIAVTGSLPMMEEKFQLQLKRGGRVFVIVGQEPAMEALLITRIGQDDWSSESLFETVLPPLRGAREPDRFVL